MTPCFPILSVLIVCAPDAPVQAPSPSLDSAPVVWQTDYQQATRAARHRKKMLFIFFHRPGSDALSREFEARSLAPAVQGRRDRFVWARLPLDTQVSVQGKPVTLIKHAAFGELHGRPGIAIIDYANQGASYYGYVVSCFPFHRRPYSARGVAHILDLPPGSLTQRTLIYAVRTHPEAPRSTSGRLHPALRKEAESHSRHQARILLQGHHAWETRFHTINARLGGMVANEVVAESWPGEGLVEAAVGCVHSWRQSSGHWGLVRRYHRCYAFDMKRGRNGIWYATGLFGGRR